jgi:IS5 family transposase
MVMRMAHAAACRCLPLYSSRFSRRDFTLPQLFACLVVKDLLKRSYRGIEAVLRDVPCWLEEIGLDRSPDHNTLWRAAKFLLQELKADRLLDVTTQWADEAGMLELDHHPLAIDSTTFDSHHVSRHYERRCQQTRKRMKAKDREKGRESSRSRTVRGLPKLAIAIASKSHLILSMWTGTGAGGDHPHFQPLVTDAWRRVRCRRFKVIGDAGYDGEAIHEFARDEMGLTSLIPPHSGRPRKDGGPPGGRWRKVMKRLLATTRSRRKNQYTRRWQVETANSMMKRNQGSALAGRSPASRKRDMRLRVITHNMMIL